MSQGFEGAELVAQLEKIFDGEKARHKDDPRRLVAFAGQATPQRVKTKAVGEVEIIPVRSELELRRRMPAYHDDHGFMAFLLGWSAREVPVDIAGRFVRHGRVHRIGRVERLRHLFGGSRTYIDVDRELADSRLGAYLVERYAPGHFESSAGKITRDAAWAAWLGREWALEAGPSLGLDTMLAWAATSARGDQMQAELAKPTAHGMQTELEAFLQRKVGDAGPVILRCWLAGRGRTLMKFAALFEVAVEDTQLAPVGAIRSVALAHLQLKDAELDAVFEPVGKGAGAAFRELAQRTDGHFVSTLLSEAQSLLSSSEHRGLAASPRLPIAWSLQLERVGEALRAGANVPSHGTLRVAVDALRGLEKHQAYLHEENQRTLERAEMATRLLAWLAARPDQARAAGVQSHAEAETLGVWYAQQGGYVDWARRRARGGGDSAFAHGVSAVLARADAARVDMDRRFAKAYVEWLRAHRPSGPLLPIDAAVSTFVAPYLEGREGRRMLVLLMDGMAWAQAVELLDDLGRGNSPWHPIAWNTMAFNPGNAFFTPVLAQLPSVTKVSRSAFFAGKPTEAGVDPEKLKDAKLWEANKSLRKLYSGTQVPKLRVKDDGFNTDGTATKATLTLIQDESQPVVALVINAIDDHLKTSTQEDNGWKVDRITALRELLDAALQAGRSVMMAADHGHVSGQQLEYATAQTNDGRGSRWRPWKQGDSIREYEVAVESTYAWAPKGDKVQGVILLADELHSYGTQRHYGEHGGAALAEVVAPAFVIGNDALKSSKAEANDSVLEARPAQAPNWWHYEVPQPTPPLANTPAKRRKSKDEVKEAAGQPLIPGVQVQTAASPAPPNASDSGAVHVSTQTRALLDKLSKNPLFKARAEHPGRRAQAVAALELLLERNNIVSSAVFTSHLGQPAYRAGGLVSKLGEILNVDGYEVILYDPEAKTVSLNAAQLRQGFGI